MNQGFIKLHRKICKWEWYHDANTFRLFIHLLLIANHDDKSWQGQMVNRGQLITGRVSLSEALGLSQQQIRTSLKKLVNTKEITIKPTNKYSLVTLINYSSYQDQDKKQPAKQPTDNQQTTNKQPTDNHKQELKELKELKEVKNIKDNVEVKEIFDYWKEKLNHPKAVLDQNRKTTIKNALKIYPVETLKQAIDGISITPHNIGQNDRNQVYDGLHIVFKNAENIERFVKTAKNPPKQLIDKHSGFSKRDYQTGATNIEELSWLNN